MNDFNELNDFKESWKSQPIQNDFSTKDFIKATNRKSKNNVRNILIISIIEFLLGLFSLGYLQYRDANTKIDFNTYNLQHINDFLQIFTIYNVIYILGFVFFILLFYSAYKKLKINISIKEYIKQIIEFRKWANIFIFWNIFLGGILVFGTLGFGLFEAITIAEKTDNLVISPKRLIILTIAIFVITLFFVLFSWIIYKLLYGRFLKRLKNNLKELEPYNN